MLTYKEFQRQEQRKALEESGAFEHWMPELLEHWHNRALAAIEKLTPLGKDKSLKGLAEWKERITERITSKGRLNRFIGYPQAPWVMDAVVDDQGQLGYLWVDI